MAILTVADAPTVRNRLGDLVITDGWTEQDLLPPFIVGPIEAAILAAHPSVVPADPDVRTAAALMVAAALYRDQPEIQQSRLADSQITLRAGETERIAASWDSIAWSILTRTYPAPTVLAPSAFVFGAIRGRR